MFEGLILEASRKHFSPMCNGFCNLGRLKMACDFSNESFVCSHELANANEAV